VKDKFTRICRLQSSKVKDELTLIRDITLVKSCSIVVLASDCRFSSTRFCIKAPLLHRWSYSGSILISKRSNYPLRVSHR